MAEQLRVLVALKEKEITFFRNRNIGSCYVVVDVIF